MIAAFEMDPAQDLCAGTPFLSHPQEHPWGHSFLRIPPTIAVFVGILIVFLEAQKVMLFTSFFCFFVPLP